MNPRLVEPGFAVVCLHADVTARPGKDENGEDDVQVARQHGSRQNPALPGAAQGRWCTGRWGTSRRRIELDARAAIGLPPTRVGQSGLT